VLYLSWNWTKVWIYYLAYTNVANKNCVKFSMKEVFKCRERRMMRWSMDKSSSLGMPMSPLEISNMYKRQSLGMPPMHPFFIGKNHVTFQNTIFLLLHALCVFLGASLLFLSVLFYFVCCNKWLDHKKFLLEKIYLLFIFQEHSVFHSYSSTNVGKGEW
jgi:hypothetical protein